MTDIVSPIADAERMVPAAPPPVPTGTLIDHDFRHMPRPGTFRNIHNVRTLTGDRLRSITGLVATLAVGLWVALDQVAGEGQLAQGPAWWVPYGVFVVVFTVDAFRFGRPEESWERTLVAVEALAASLTYLADPSLGWSAVLMVVSAASGAYTLSPRVVGGLVLGQTSVVGVGQAARGGNVWDALLAMMVYGSFQAFAVLVVMGERRQAEARSAVATANVELRATSAMLAHSTQLSERLRIARELHDLVGHQLTALSIELEVASHHSYGEGGKHVERARDTAKALLNDVRDVVGDLRAPPTGLSQTLHEVVDGVPGVDIELRVWEESDVPEETAMTVIRCVQEVVTNTLRHADADRLSIVVRSEPSVVTIDAADDGRGARVVHPGYGLTGMRERVEGQGGALEVEGRPGRGFKIVVRIPS